MAFEDYLRERAKQLPMLDAGHPDFDAMERKWTKLRTTRKFQHEGAGSKWGVCLCTDVAK